MKLPTVPPINREEGRALQPDGPEYWTRRACGNEVLLGLEARNRRGDYDMFFSTTAKFHGLGYHKAATSFYDFKRSAHRAWQGVRWDHSEIAGFATYDEQLKCLVRYPLPNSRELGKKWADQTIVSEMSTRTAMEIRDELAAAPRVSKHREDGVVIYMIADVPDMKVPIGDTELRFLFHVNPLFLDGIGVPNTVGRFFYRLAYELTQEHDPLPTDVYIPGWEESMFYVLDGAKYLLHANQVISGPVYDDALKEHLKGVDRMMNSWGLQIDENEFGKPSTLIHTFTERETGSMHRAMKDKMGKGYSFLHLTHAAMLLALVKINPPPPKSDPQAYVPLIFMRGILYLKSTYAFRVIPFWPVCQCNGTIIYEDIIKYAQADGKENDVTTIKHMTQAMKIAKETYAQSLARPTTLLPTSITVMEMYATMVNSTPAKDLPKLTQPLLVTGMLYDPYIRHHYWIEEANGTTKQIFTLGDVPQLCINAFTETPLFHLSSWGDVERLTCDFNTKYYSHEYMQRYLDLVAEYMVAFTKDWDYREGTPEEEYEW